MKRNLFICALLCFICITSFTACDLSGLLDLGDIENIDENENEEENREENGQEENKDKEGEGEKKEDESDFMNLPKLYDNLPVGVFEYKLAIWGDDIEEARPDGIAKASDGSIGYFTDKRNENPTVYIAEGSRLHNLSWWKQKETHINKMKEYTGVDVVEQVKDYENEELLIKHSGILSMGVSISTYLEFFMQYWNSWRELDNPEDFEKQGTEIIAGISTEKYFCETRTEFYGIISASRETIWIDDEGNCIKYLSETSNDGGETFSSMNAFEIIWHTDQVADADAIAQSFYRDSAASSLGVDDFFLNEHEIFDGGWAYSAYPSDISLQSLWDWGTIYEGKELNDLIPPFTESGTISSMKFLREPGLTGFDSIFEINVSVKSPDLDDIRAYISALNTLQAIDDISHVDWADETTIPDIYKELGLEFSGETMTFISYEMLSGADLEWRPHLTFGDKYKWIEYEINYNTAEYMLEELSDLLIIKIAIGTTTIV